MNIFYLALLIFLFNSILYFKFNLISKFFVIIDKPDTKLKRHSKPALLIGGLIILINFYLIIFLFRLMEVDNSIFEQNFLYGVIILSTLFFIIGLIDDLKNLTPNLKLLFLTISIIFVIYLFPEMKLEKIKISFLDKIYYFNEYSSIFIILSFLLLANAINMFDGINLQLILYSIFVLILFILKGFVPIFFMLLLISFIFLSILNFKNKIFLGDSGAYFISSLLGCTFIYQYKSYGNFLYGDEIFIILLIPAIDMLRLFILRVINKKHPFKGDLNHLHHEVDHYVKNKNLTVLITISLSVFPCFLMFLGLKTYYILFLNLIIYISLILFLKNKNNI